MGTGIETTGLLTLFISSSVLATLLSIGGSHLLAQLQFKRDYFKELIAKRLNAYQQVDELIGILRGTTYDDSGRVVHMLFLNHLVHERAMQLIAITVGVGLYLSEEVRGCLSDINFVLLKLPYTASEEEGFEIGVVNRSALLEMRQRLELLVATDLLSLYKVRRFLLAKRQRASNPDPKYPAHLPKHGAYSFPARNPTDDTKGQD